MKTIILFFVQIFVALKILTPIRVARLKFFYKLHRWPNFEHPKDPQRKNQLDEVLRGYKSVAAAGRQVSCQRLCCRKDRRGIPDSPYWQVGHGG